jgi:ribosomal protein S2
MNITRIHLAH